MRFCPVLRHLRRTGSLLIRGPPAARSADMPSQFIPLAALSIAASLSAGAFDTGTIAPGASRTVVLKRPGTYTYYCQFHAFMRATVVVK
jgi:Copper binding proteins, plastocyanin/azurin family